jgi:hypothetical protein
MAACIGFALDKPHHTGAPDLLGHLIAAEFPQLRGYDRRSAMGVIEEFRVFVQVAPPGGDFSVHVSQSVLDRHLISPLQQWSLSQPCST